MSTTQITYSKNRGCVSPKYYYQSVLHLEELKEKYEPQVPHAKNYYHFLEPLIISTAERTWLVRKPILEGIFVRPAIVDRTWLKLSPVGMYDAATQAWAGTNLEGIQDFFVSVRQYRQAVIDYFQDKDIFASRQWFSADKGAVNWSIFPQFSFQKADVGTYAKRALPDVFLLLITNLILFIVIFLIFQKREV